MHAVAIKKSGREKTTDHAVSVLESASRTGNRGSEQLPRILVYRSQVELDLGHKEEARTDAHRALEHFATFYHGGVNDGRVQNFVTPGLMFRKFKLERDPRNRLALMFGGGMQIATTQFHTYNHGLVLSTRMLF